MKISLSWLKELVDINTDVEDIAESLSMSGFEVEEIIDQSSLVDGLIIGFIREIKEHPNANKLQICTVDIGKKECLQVVCGASNVRENIHVLVAIEGSYLKAIDLKIKSSSIRGIESKGMICSLSEIGLEENSKGIAVLDDLYSDLPQVGSSPNKLLGLDEVILDLAITANRPDGMSMIGIAREVSAIKKAKLTLPKCTFDKNEYTLFTPNYLTNEIIAEEGIYTIHYIENLDGSIESPDHIKTRLINSGLNSINLIVDITNYVMLEQGQPLHAFDADLLDKICNKKVKNDDFGFRKAKEGEKFNGVDGKQYILSESVSLVTCSDIPIAIAGVLGSQYSSVNNQTNRIWLESALFTQKSVRNSSRAIGKRTDSSSRYEKGISSNITISSANRAIQLLQKYFNCTVHLKSVNKEIDYIDKRIKLRKEKIQSVLGQLKVKNNENSINNSHFRDLSNEEIEESLNLLGCETNAIKEGWYVKAPLNRTNDLFREIDFIEEIARLIGYDKFDSNLPDPIKPGGLNPQQKTERKLRNYLSSAGLQEVNCSSLVPENKDTNNYVSISNPLLKETNTLRTNLWEEHLKICKRNISSGQNSCWIFEIGKIYFKDNDLIKEESKVSGLIVGKKSLGKWHDKSQNSDIEYYEARGLLESVFKSFSLSVTDKKLESNLLYHPGKSSSLFLEGKNFGTFGQLHPILSDNENMNYKVFLFEFKLEQLLLACTRKNKLIKIFKPYPIVPCMERDISVLLNKEISCDSIKNLILKVGKPLVVDVDLIDIYSSSNLEEGQVSLTYRIKYRKSDDTLREEDISPIHDIILQSLFKSFKASLR